MLLNFMGSDWCPPCIAMHKAVFIKPALLDFAQKNLILIEVDYPRRKPLSAKVTEQNQRLMRQYQIEQLPTVVLLNPEGNSGKGKVTPVKELKSLWPG